MKILILGHARHGKDTVAELIVKHTDLELKSASIFAAEKFIFDTLKKEVGYSSIEECFEDRINHRKEWFDLIHKYNEGDLARLARELMQQSDIYVGMRDGSEIDTCLNEGVFDLVIGVWDPRKKQEPQQSFNVNIFEVSDFVIFNNKGLEELEEKIQKIFKNLSNEQK